jgi:hypothetical protein
MVVSFADGLPGFVRQVVRMLDAGVFSL